LEERENNFCVVEYLLQYKYHDELGEMNQKQMDKISLKYTEFQPRRKGWGQEAFGASISPKYKEGLSYLTGTASSSGSIQSSLNGAVCGFQGAQLSRTWGCYQVSKTWLLKINGSNLQYTFS
jgi:hypothetical protein